MARYERRPVLQSIANPNAAEAQAAGTLADILHGFGQKGVQQYEQMRMQDAREAAGSQEVKAGEDPGLMSPLTKYGREYNNILKKAYAAETRNAYTQRFDELSLEHQNNPEAFEDLAATYRDEILNGTPAEMREFARIDMDASIHSYAHAIRTKTAEDNLKLAAMEADKATDGLQDDAMNDIRNGRDEIFLTRRQAYVDAVMSDDRYTPLAKAEKVKAFDEQADAMYHIGEVERLLDAGNMKGAMDYKRKLERGKFKTFGDHAADRDAVIAELDKSIGNYYNDYTKQDAIDDEIKSDMQQRNFDGLMRKQAEGQASSVDALQMFTRGQISYNQYKESKAMEKAGALRTTNESWVFMFHARLPGMTVAEQEQELFNGVMQGQIKPEDARPLLEKVRNEEYSMLSAPAAKRGLKKLRTSLGISEFMDMTNATAATKAQAYNMAEEEILAGTPVDTAVTNAMIWYKKTNADDFVEDQFVNPIRTPQEWQKAMDELKANAGNMPSEMVKKELRRLDEIKKRFMINTEGE